MRIRVSLRPDDLAVSKRYFSHDPNGSARARRVKGNGDFLARLQDVPAPAFPGHRAHIAAFKRVVDDLTVFALHIHVNRDVRIAPGQFGNDACERDFFVGVIRRAATVMREQGTGGKG